MCSGRIISRLSDGAFSMEMIQIQIQAINCTFFEMRFTPGSTARRTRVTHKVNWLQSIHVFAEINASIHLSAI